MMATPSMCPAVCVGSLVADQPLNGALHTGELISFHPPGSMEIYTHKVSAILRNGMIQTRGIANPTHDPWLITRSARRRRPQRSPRNWNLCIWRPRTLLRVILPKSNTVPRVGRSTLQRRSLCGAGERYGAGEGTRTPNPQVRSLVLWSIELHRRAQIRFVA